MLPCLGRGQRPALGRPWATTTWDVAARGPPHPHLAWGVAGPLARHPANLQRPQRRPTLHTETGATRQAGASTRQ
eukprot:1857050-Lingulodinium_polyedra.AAC.1